MCLIDNIENINFHDAELVAIKCDYINEIAYMKLRLSYSNILIRIIFDKFKKIGINNMSLWGEGYYIVSVSVKKEENIKFEFLLNSGDKVYIETENIILEKQLSSKK